MSSETAGNTRGDDNFMIAECSGCGQVGQYSQRLYRDQNYYRIHFTFTGSDDNSSKFCGNFSENPRWLKAPPKENEDKAEASLEGEEGEEEEEDSQTITSQSTTTLSHGEQKRKSLATGHMSEKDNKRQRKLSKSNHDSDADASSSSEDEGEVHACGTCGREFVSATRLSDHQRRSLNCAQKDERSNRRNSRELRELEYVIASTSPNASEEEVTKNSSICEVKDVADETIAALSPKFESRGTESFPLKVTVDKCDDVDDKQTVATAGDNENVAINSSSLSSNCDDSSHHNDSKQVPQRSDGNQGGKFHESNTSQDRERSYCYDKSEGRDYSSHTSKNRSWSSGSGTPTTKQPRNDWDKGRSFHRQGDQGSRHDDRGSGFRGRIAHSDRGGDGYEERGSGYGVGIGHNKRGGGYDVRGSGYDGNRASGYDDRGNGYNGSGGYYNDRGAGYNGDGGHSSRIVNHDRGYAGGSYDGFRHNDYSPSGKYGGVTSQYRDSYNSHPAGNRNGGLRWDNAHFSGNQGPHQESGQNYTGGHVDNSWKGSWTSGRNNQQPQFNQISNSSSASYRNNSYTGNNKGRKSRFSD